MSAPRTVPATRSGSAARSVLINLRVTPAERDLMHARCRALGVTVSEAIRAILCRPPPTPKGPKP